ncbi:hypothetical protein THIARS_60150 [Thiomonas delicata]|uniref:Uncharacterized protein n=1 Tax=Thiomonas delicata TaxID=364030 RepID=A0A238D2D1_THIDL|nr:hypothetical protein THIARS_60150 [Thiomonas delicata]
MSTDADRFTRIFNPYSVNIEYEACQATPAQTLYIASTFA